MIDQWIPIEFEDDEFEHDDLWFEDDEDEWEQAIGDCYFDPILGFCLIAGTEYCDWDCPFSADDFEEETSPC